MFQAIDLELSRVKNKISAMNSIKTIFVLVDVYGRKELNTPWVVSGLESKKHPGLRLWWVTSIR